MHAGPLGLFLVYVFMGTICLATMVSTYLYQFYGRIDTSLITALPR